MSYTEYMAQLVARCLDCAVLNLPCNLRSEFAHRNVILGKVRVVSGIALDADLPTLLCHSEDEGPTVLGIKICISKHQ
jgi:hypothetical protein